MVVEEVESGHADEAEEPGKGAPGEECGDGQTASRKGAPGEECGDGQTA